MVSLLCNSTAIRLPKPHFSPKPDHAPRPTPRFCTRRARHPPSITAAASGTGSSSNAEPPKRPLPSQQQMGTLFPGGFKRPEIKVPTIVLQLNSEEVLRSKDALDAVDVAVSKWAGIVVLDAGEGSGGRLYEAARALKSVIGERAYLLITERVDVAAAVGASGVVLSDQGLPAIVARNMMMESKTESVVLPLVGRTVQTANSALIASNSEGADFLILVMDRDRYAEVLDNSAYQHVKVPIFTMIASLGEGPLFAAATKFLQSGASGLVISLEDIKLFSDDALDQLLTGYKMNRLIQSELQISNKHEMNLNDGFNGRNEVSGFTKIEDKEKQFIEVEKLVLLEAISVIRKAAPLMEEVSLLVDAVSRLDDPFLLVIAGEFNSGKSTVINALLGRRYLKEGVIPTTNEITLLCYSEMDYSGQQCCERHPDGQYICYLPAPILKEMNLVDTPGTNVILQRQQRLTEEFVPRADLLFFVISADRPLTESEVSFLRYVQQWKKRVVFVLNKSDLYQNNSELEEATAFIKENAQKLLNTEHVILFPVSARSALKAKLSASLNVEKSYEELLSNDPRWKTSGFRELETFLYSFLDGSTETGIERMRLKLETPIGIADRLLSACYTLVRQECEYARQDLISVKEIISSVKEYAMKIERESHSWRKQTFSLIKTAKARAVKLTESTLQLSNIDLVASYFKGEKSGSMPATLSIQNEIISPALSDVQRLLGEYLTWLHSSNTCEGKRIKETFEKRWPTFVNSRHQVHSEAYELMGKGDEVSLQVVTNFSPSAAAKLFEQEVREVEMARTKSSLVLERQNPQQQEVEAGKHNKRKRAQDKQSRNTPVSVEKKAKKTINHYQFRSNLVSTVTLIQSIKPLVTEQHVVELKKTPFWNLIESMLDNKITEQMCRKYDNDIMLILDTYNNKRRQFRLGKSYVPFTANDISLIFGIPNGTRKLDLKYSKRKTTEFISRRFNTGSRVSAPQIKQQLHLALNGQSETDIADVARLLCLYILVVIFFATHGNTIGWAYVGYVENYMDMNHYAWAEEISKFLMESVHSRSRGSDRVIGCLIALPYWLCEHTTIITPNDSVHLPRLLKWNLRAVTMALRKRTLHSLLATEVLSDELDSTLLEMQRFQPLIESGIHDEREIIDIEGKEEVSEKEKDEIAETEEDNNNEDGEGDEEERDGGEMEEGIEGENVDQGEDQGEGNKEKQNELEEGGQEAENKTIKSNQPDTDIMQDTLVISELEEQLQNNNSEETNYTSVATQSVTFGVEMSGYEEMSLQTDLLVANILADIIGSTSNTVNEEQSEAHSQSVPKAGDNIPCHKDQSQSAENSKLKSLTEERDRATSLVIQLTNEKTELQAQIQRMAIELERMSAEKNIMKKQSIENEIRITSLIVERDDALLFVDQLTREKNSLEKQNMESNQAVEESSRMVSSLKEQLKHTMTVSDVQSSRAANAENEVKSLKKKLINVESNNLKLQKLLKEMTIDYTEKRLELAQKSLDDIFEPPRKFNSQQKESIMIEKSVEEDAANQNFEGNIPEIKSSDAQSKTIKEVKQSSMVKRIKKRTATRKMNPTAAPFTLPKNAVTKLMNASDVEKLKQIYEADGNSALVWGGEGRHAVSYEDIIAVLSRAEMSSTVIDCYAEMLYREQEEIHEQLSTVHGEEMVPPEKAYFVTSLCWKFVTSSSSEMREKILHPQISPSRTANHRFVLFPMNSNGKRKDAEPFHWTLLVLDQKEGDWLHYNSLRPRSAKTVDHYFEDARLLKQYVENYNYINVEDTQPYGAPLVSVDDAPQQKMGSVDCGVVVCYLMKQLTHNQIIVSKLPQHVIDGLRAEIAIKFLNDKHRSWTIENFHARKHPYDDDFEQQ